MITLQNAYEIATSEVRVPPNAVLTYSNLLSNRYVFEWKHVDGDAYSEIDRILIWIDPISGELLKKDIEWSALKQPMLSKTSIHSTSAFGIVIQDYWKIAKEAYFTYSGEPLQDYYWIGKVGSGCEATCYLIDDYGNIVGQMIPLPTANGASFSGYQNFDPDEFCWDTSFYQNYFNEWVDGYIETGCGISEETYRTCVSDPDTPFYQCTAHGSWSGFRISTDFLVNNTYIDNIMADRPPIPFAHLCHCKAMDYIGLITISYAYRKGSDVNTVVSGLAHTTSESWSTYLNYWRWCYFTTIDGNRDTPINQIFYDCIATYPSMDGHLGIAGDPLLTLNNIINGLCSSPNCTFGVIQQ